MPGGTFTNSVIIVYPNCVRHRSPTRSLSWKSCRMSAGSPCRRLVTVHIFVVLGVRKYTRLTTPPTNLPLVTAIPWISVETCPDARLVTGAIFAFGLPPRACICGAVAVPLISLCFSFLSKSVLELYPGNQRQKFVGGDTSRPGHTCIRAVFVLQSPPNGRAPCHPCP